MAGHAVVHKDELGVGHFRSHHVQTVPEFPAHGHDDVVLLRGFHQSGFVSAGVVLALHHAAHYAIIGRQLLQAVVGAVVEALIAQAARHADADFQSIGLFTFGGSAQNRQRRYHGNAQNQRKNFFHRICTLSVRFPVFCRRGYDSLYNIPPDFHKSPSDGNRAVFFSRFFPFSSRACPKFPCFTPARFSAFPSVPGLFSKSGPDIGRCSSFCSARPPPGRRRPRFFRRRRRPRGPDQSDNPPS